MNANIQWVPVCEASELAVEDVRRFDHDAATYAIYHVADGFYASDGLCTHEHAHLADGLVLDDTIECPLHNGRFHIPTGKALNPPVCINLKTYPVELRNSLIQIGLPANREA